MSRQLPLLDLGGQSEPQLKLQMIFEFLIMAHALQTAFRLLGDNGRMSATVTRSAWSRALSFVGPLVLVAGCEGQDPPDEPPLHQSLLGVEITLAEAIESAETTHPAGVTIEAELGRRDDRPIYEVERLDAGEIYEVVLDARNGTVLTTSMDTEDLAEAEAAAVALANAPITLADALSAAEEQTGGFPVEIEVDQEFIEVVVVIEQEVSPLAFSLEDGARI